MSSQQTKVTVIMDVPKFVREQNKKLGRVAAEMGVDILNRAIMNAPKDSGALVRSGRISKKGETSVVVSFGDNSVRYARFRHFVNKKNPGTKLYLKRAAESVARGNTGKYFR